MKDSRRWIAGILAVVLMVVLLPVVSAAEEEAASDSIEAQIRAYADSIDQSGADDDAAWALAGHGISKNGKKLTVDASHPLTATLMNAELTQKALSFACTELIRIMDELHESEIYSAASLMWYESGNSYALYACSSDNDAYTEMLYQVLSYSNGKYNKTNSYDKSLEWMGGTVGYFVHMERTKVTADQTEYQVNVRFTDRFDFDASNSSSVPKALLSLLGSFLFDAFDWEATASFRITAPYECDHSSGSYHWVYDPDTEQIINTVDGEHSENALTRLYVLNEKDERVYYYRLDKTAHLYHDRPWVLEYTVKSPGTFALSPLEKTGTPYPCILNRTKEHLFFHEYERVKLNEQEMKDYGTTKERQSLTHFYGTALKSLFTYSSKYTYTLRLENEIRPDGSNMVYLTVYNQDLAQTVLERTAMDDYYLTESWGKARVFQQDGSSWISGKDIFINYIGNKTDRVPASLKEVTIWENGKGAENPDHLSRVVTKPTCTAEGYTTYTCALCGYSGQEAQTPATGHSFGDWEVVREATAQAPGEQKRTCRDCGHEERTEIPKLESLPGDATCDGEVNALDVILLRQYLAGWNVTVDTRGADTNGDGKINPLDVILLRQYLAGWDVSLGK